MAEKVWVSFNRSVYDGIKDEKELEERGFLIIDSYGNDFDLGTIWEYSKGEDAKEVYERHIDYIEKCTMK